VYECTGLNGQTQDILVLLHVLPDKMLDGRVSEIQTDLTVHLVSSEVLFISFYITVYLTMK